MGRCPQIPASQSDSPSFNDLLLLTIITYYDYLGFWVAFVLLGGHGGPNHHKPIGSFFLFFCVSFSPVFPLLLGLLAPILGGWPCIGFESSTSGCSGVLLLHVVVRVARGWLVRFYGRSLGLRGLWLWVTKWVLRRFGVKR